MKIRCDYVSNSSSSSFVLLGATMDIDKFKKQVKDAGWESEDEDDEFWEMKDWVEDKTDNFIEVECSDDGSGDVDCVLVGAAPSEMKDDETLKDFKQRIADAIGKAGIKVEAKDMEFTSGGSTPEGMSFIGSCG